MTERAGSPIHVGILVDAETFATLGLTTATVVPDGEGCSRSATRRSPKRRRAGATYQSILKHYYRGIALESRG